MPMLSGSRGGMAELASGSARCWFDGAGCSACDEPCLDHYVEELDHDVSWDKMPSAVLRGGGLPWRGGARIDNGIRASRIDRRTDVR